MSSVPTRIRALTAWLTLLACVWAVCAVPASEMVCVSGMPMPVSTCSGCVAHAPTAAASLTRPAPGLAPASVQSHCCVERSTQVTPAVAAGSTRSLATAPLAPAPPASAVDPMPPGPYLASLDRSTSPPVLPHESSPTILRL